MPTEMDQLEALYFEGRFLELENRTRLLVEQHPRAGFLWSVLGTALQMQGKDALPALQKAVDLLPDDAMAHSSLGNALHNLGQLDQAAKSYRKALEIHPDFAEVHCNLGNTLKDLGQQEAAEASYRKALEINPEFAEAHFNLGVALKGMDKLGEAEVCYLRAIQLKPDFAEAHTDLGSTLKDLGRLHEAASSFRRAIQLRPNFTEALGNLGTTLKDLGDLDQAVTNFRRALQIDPDFAEAHNNLGTILHDLGHFEESETAYRRAIQINPNLVDAHSNLLFQLSHKESVDARTLFLEHLRFAKQFEEPLRHSWPQHSNPRDPKRCLNVGFVSGDLRDHAVANFIEPVLAHLAARQHLSLHAYYNHTIDDDVTRRLKDHFAYWHPIVGLSDMALAQKIREDGIDVLVDLSSHTAKHRLLTFARKPAPVQVSWMGYAGTTGLSAMDYYLADRYFLPPGQFDDQFSEKLVQLPASSPFLPFSDAPPVNALPALKNGYVTFGSFNLLRKLTPSVVAVWAQILRAIPDARMVCGAMPQEGDNQMLIEWFAQVGIARERLTFHPKYQMKDYLALHHQVDICLDTFPYPGGTTSCHALWMGVPTLTLAGVTPVSRVGALIQNHVGMEQFIAFEKTEFVQKGLCLASNISELARNRNELRTRFMQSTMGQPDIIAGALERALQVMWQRWCAGLPAESFAVS